MQVNKKSRNMIMACLFLVLLFATSLSAMAAVTISKESMTLQTGQSATLTLSQNGSAVSGASWGSSDTDIATVSSSGTVTAVAPGSCVITAMANGSTQECLVSVVKTTTAVTTRYNVLIMDTSRSMKGSPLSKAKTAAKRFIDKVLSADGTNYVAVISLSSTASVLCQFTGDAATAKKAVNSFKASGSTNTRAAFAKANSLLKAAADGSNVMKNVILCSDGLPRAGSKEASGRYSSSDYKYYKYANAVYSLDRKMKKKGYFIYALGFFHNSTGNELAFGKRFMKDLASKDKYYLIQDANDIDKAFENISENIISLSISDKSLSMKAGDVQALTVYNNGAKTSASWTSSKPSVASVSQNGTVTAVSAGSAVITATVDGKTISCKVKVKANVTISLDKTSLSLNVDETANLTAAVTGTTKSVSWSSSKPSVATVSSAGVVKGVKKGSCVVTATVAGKSASCKVTVKNPYPSGTKKFTGHHYKLFDKSMTWAEAKAYCEKLGGHLVTITSAEEQTFVEEYVKKGSRNFYWMGAKRNSYNRFSTWITGETISYTHYDTQNGEPNNFRGKENVLVIYRLPNPNGGSSGALKWNDLCEDGTCNGETFFGTANAGFICEWDT